MVSLHLIRWGLMLAFCLALNASGVLALHGVGHAAEPEKVEPPIAFAARAVGNGTRFRLLVDFDKPLKQKTYLLANPKRLIVDLPESVFSLPDDAGKSPSLLVKNIRYGTVAKGKSRIILALTQPVRIAVNSFEKVKDQDRYRLIVDIQPTDDASFEKLAEEGEKLASKGKVAWKGDRIERVENKERKFTIVLDPGHGGIDGGALGRRGTIEKNVTLKFAKSLKKQLGKSSHYAVLLTRDEDVFVPLEERMQLARRNQADLFISIHADSLRQSRIRGATIYTLSEEGTDDLSNQLAEKQNRSDLIAGLGLPELAPNVNDILIDLTRRETEEFSHQFASIAVRTLKDEIRLIKNPHRAANFFVLRAADVPSILVELGYLSNPQDERLMRSTRWLEKAALKLSKAIDAFFLPRLAKE